MRPWLSVLQDQCAAITHAGLILLCYSFVCHGLPRVPWRSLPGARGLLSGYQTASPGYLSFAAATAVKANSMALARDCTTILLHGFLARHLARDSSFGRPQPPRLPSARVSQSRHAVIPCVVTGPRHVLIHLQAARQTSAVDFQTWPRHGQPGVGLCWNPCLNGVVLPPGLNA
ncbi:hypothetical protein CDD81_5305 [Ophiocordyceps australis]|uniref:Uncharacterized protein n=1 Tax=Ophiocordyceps australis TaxID=1399860 RepID=A0A2C5YH61_9HYPO|nr:hypothetical protein CDD81_5305 [Ophiocordyceps australis]